MDTENDEEAQSALWYATLEMFCHQILYVRRLYPKDSFASARFLGIQCYANRHPQVVEYISQTVEMAAASLLEGTSNELSVLIMDQISEQQHEKYTLSFAQRPLYTMNSLQEREQDSKELILSVLTLEGVPTPAWDSSTNFRIDLFLPTKISANSELSKNLAAGRWFCPDREGLSRAGERRRPLYHMSSYTGKFYFEVNLDKNNQQTDPTRVTRG